MDRNQIVIVTQTQDAHADDVIVALERTGNEAVRINTDEIPADARISMSWGEGDAPAARIDVLTSGRTMNAATVRSVWWRRPASYAFPGDLSLREAEFAKDETDHALRSLWASLDCYWISEPERIRQASWKGEQLMRASQLGFDVPRTLVTTDPDNARQFFHDCGKRMVFKAMSDPFLGAVNVSRKYPGERIALVQSRTSLVTDNDLGMLDSVRVVPCLFQEYVPKRVELRITVIGERIFAAEIHSQENEETVLDWRNSSLDIPYRVAELPGPVAQKCLALVKSYGLNFSAIDMIVTPDGRYVFLENNPNGQFIFVEHKLPELAMTDELAACLIRGSNS
jgi:glutathione synthase/RimK-type ligase-like ATP-grasp enzyme